LRFRRSDENKENNSKNKESQAGTVTIRDSNNSKDEENDEDFIVHYINEGEKMKRNYNGHHDGDFGTRKNVGNPRSPPLMYNQGLIRNYVNAFGPTNPHNLIPSSTEYDHRSSNEYLYHHNYPVGQLGHHSFRDHRTGYPSHHQTGLHAPYYPPSYGVFNVYQEINFQPEVRNRVGRK